MFKIDTMKLFQLLLSGLFLFTSHSLSAQKSLPEVSIKTLEGQAVNIKDYADNGKVTVLSFWATWCIPCQNELDAIADLYPDWQTKYDMELVAITIDTRRALAKVKPILSQKGWEYIVLSDEKGELKQQLNFQAIPQTFVLDKEGNIVYSHSGYVPGDEYELEDVLKGLAGK